MSKYYFYTDGEKEFGPFSIKDLKEKDIKRNTKVWTQGMNEWQEAGSVPELAELFVLTPPPFSKEEPKTEVVPQKAAASQSRKYPPKTWLVESILATLFCCLPFGIVGIVNAAKVESRFYAGDEQAAERASADARRWTLVSFWVAIGGWLLVAAYYVFVIVLALGITTSFFNI